MSPISLCYHKNVFIRHHHRLKQYLGFLMVVENLAFAKQVAVNWCGEDGQWQTVSAVFHSRLDAQREYWLAEVQVSLSNQQSLPGNVRFNLSYRVAGQVFWLDDNGVDFASEADCGVVLFGSQSVQVIDFSPVLSVNQRYVPITVAVSSHLPPEQVNVLWSVDDWRTVQTSRCFFQRRFWDKTYLSHARNPNQYGVMIWKTWLKVGSAFRLRFCIACETPTGTIYDNNFGLNYALARKPLSVMVLNLHCRQEADQDEKLTCIAKAIDEQEVDVVCFQEVAEAWNQGLGDWDTNTAKIINDCLPKPFFLYTDWSHLGFGCYREGLAILSRYPLCHASALFVSESTDPFSIDARKVLMAEIDIPYMGRGLVFSAHLSWWENGFAGQFKRLQAWVQSLMQISTQAVLLCGDFNVPVASAGYRLVVEEFAYRDPFLALCPAVDSACSPAGEGRIDYVFVDDKSRWQAVSARVLFTEADYGRVSDHAGFLMTFEPFNN